MDYKEIMDKNKIDFSNIYEIALGRIFNDVELTDAEFLEELKKKREFGLKKYGEYSFQGTFENSMTSPVEEHLTEELVDACNYAAHIVYQNKIIGDKETEQKYSAILARLFDIYKIITS